MHHLLSLYKPRFETLGLLKQEDNYICITKRTSFPPTQVDQAIGV